MKLSRTDLSPEILAELQKLNVRDVETLLSMLAVPTGLIAIARVLKMSEDGLRHLAARLRSQNPDLDITAASGPFHPMGHRVPSGKAE
jgi:hypothetical protein